MGSDQGSLRSAVYDAVKTTGLRLYTLAPQWNMRSWRRYISILPRECCPANTSFPILIDHACKLTRPQRHQAWFPLTVVT
mmetsp:Transcript_27438/g.109927  ORF Transcript_27438/g.109927 Transcript_27438/m.109927 type:complete len:80 (-) Transcript_27438:293-532(-)